MDQTLTTAEEKVMQILWALEEAVIRDILRQYPSPKPAYTTVATIIKILEKKGFVAHKSIGNTHLYSPVVSKSRYKNKMLKSLMKNYFSDSFSNLVSHFSKRDELSASELEELIAHLQEEVKTKRLKND
jgi:predicted transcriptional regulator